VGPIGAGPRWK